MKVRTNMIDYSITSLRAGTSPGSSEEMDLFNMCVEECIFTTLRIYVLSRILLLTLCSV